jgi:uroporphyrinogen-III synthase
MQNKIQILSTKKISDSFIRLADENNICIDQLSFIETEKSVSEEIKNRISELSKQHITAVFTSSNAASALGKLVAAETNWKIFCIEPATKKTVEHIFKNSSIAGTGKDAQELSEKIINDKSVKEVIFFCGNQRRHLLPEQLKNNGINVKELVVYRTVEKPQIVSKKYDGILFFSPSAVRSFFAKNKPDTTSQIFATGKTTNEEVKRFLHNKTVISEIPGTEKLIDEVIKYFSAIKTV